MGFAIGFVIGATVVGLIWGYRGYLGRKFAAAEQTVKDKVSGVL